MISVGIIGGSGYTGKKLVGFCSGHDNIKEFKVYGFSTSGESLLSLFPELMGIINDDVIINIKDLSLNHDVYFIALPHGEALNYVPKLIGAGKTVIDLGGDYRLDDAAEYNKWYKLPHNSEGLLKEKIYGLADVKDTDYTSSWLVANPGCYPTAVSLSLIPIVRELAGNIVTISTSAYSGTSGAGKSAKQELLMAEMDGNVAAYNVNSHRHYPEILQTLKHNGFISSFSFAAHLLPVSAGIYSTSFIHLDRQVSRDEINELYTDFYKQSVFVRLRQVPPKLTWVVNTNFCDLNISAKDNIVIITAAIDNLVKGASGQAVQNLNKLYKWDETMGIISKGVKNVSVY
jgi:N-acetyl-gamma-glutamyl-phosphate reductase